MPIPDKTSVDAYLQYTHSKLLRPSRGKAWRDLKAWIHEPLRETDALAMPGVSEPYLAWTFSGDVEFQEREGGGPWLTHRIQAGSFFLTTGGGPYECRWKQLSAEPFLAMMVFIELPLFNRAVEEVFGADAPKVSLRNLSAFTDPELNWLMEKIRQELMAPKASVLRVQGLAQLIAVHLVRHYAEVPTDLHGSSAALPGFKLNQITHWIKTHLDEEFDLDQLAAMAGLSKFHFHRLFRQATGVSPAKFQTAVRMQEAQRRLRETKESIVAIALDVGFTSPSHFAQVFRRETGMAPSEYRRQA